MLIWFCFSENETLGQFVPLDPNLGQFNGFCGQALAVDIFFFFLKQEAVDVVAYQYEMDYYQFVFLEINSVKALRAGICSQ